VCSWGCEKEFRSRKEAKNHWKVEPCAGMDASNDCVATMFELQKRLGRTNLEPVNIARQKEAPTIHTRMKSSETTTTAVERKESQTQITDWLQSLPAVTDRASRIKEVERFVRTSPFTDHGESEFELFGELSYY